MTDIYLEKLQVEGKENKYHVAIPYFTDKKVVGLITIGSNRVVASITSTDTDIHPVILDMMQRYELQTYRDLSYMYVMDAKNVQITLTSYSGAIDIYLLYGGSGVICRPMYLRQGIAGQVMQYSVKQQTFFETWDHRVMYPKTTNNLGIVILSTRPYDIYGYDDNLGEKGALIESYAGDINLQLVKFANADMYNGLIFNPKSVSDVVPAVLMVMS